MSLRMAGILLFSLSVFALQGAPYDGELSEDDPSVQDYIGALATGQSLPEELRLRYSGVRQDIYFSFYDRLGKEVWFQFREDKWDDRPLKLLTKLVPGQAYGIRGAFLGILNETNLIRKEQPDFRAALGDQNGRLLFAYETHRPLRMEQILF